MTSVDLDAYASRDIPFVERKGALRYEGNDGFFEYRHVGSTPAGTHVLMTAENGGGSGVFESVLLVRFESDWVTEDGVVRRRFSLRRVGEVTLGDRDDGRVELRGDVLVIGASRYRAHESTFRLE